MSKVKVALVYDFDKTLSPKDMQEFHYLPSIGYNDASKFWAESNDLAKKYNCDGVLAYMYLMTIKDNNLSKKKLIEEGKYIKLYKGVDTWFKRINEYGKSKGVEVEHYIISSGLEDIIKGTSIASEFKKIYACQYMYDSKGKVLWPSRAVNYTLKTQYLFRINNGVFNESNDFDLNKSTPDDEKHIPISNMIYIGDGLTDVPSMKVVSQNGGTTIAVYEKNKVNSTAHQLKQDKRANYSVEANYTKGSKIEKIVQNTIDILASKNKLDHLK